jgi:hypothetical protein
MRSEYLMFVCVNYSHPPKIRGTPRCKIKYLIELTAEGVGMARMIYLRAGVPVFAPSGARVVGGSGRAKPHIILDGVEFKHCPWCNTWRRLSKFAYSGFTWDGLQDICVFCHEQYSRVRSEERKPARIVCGAKDR